MHGPNNIFFCNDGHIEQRQNEKETVLKGREIVQLGKRHKGFDTY